MIGFGRAVGETMIVLMATGNTAIMEWNVFEGMRTLSANVAVEMGEAEVSSTHFRILFLSALVLFVLTFILNTAAETGRDPRHGGGVPGRFPAPPARRRPAAPPRPDSHRGAGGAGGHVHVAAQVGKPAAIIPLGHK